jgi:hypothetical protein
MSLNLVTQRGIQFISLIGDIDMTTNLGNLDRIFRALLGIVLLAAPFVSGLAIFNGTTATIISVIAGLVMLGTSAVKFCPIYRIFGIRTCKL